MSTPRAAALTAAVVALPLLPALAPTAGAAAAPGTAAGPSLTQVVTGQRAVVRGTGVSRATTVAAPTRQALAAARAAAGLTSTRTGPRASALSQWTVQFSGGSAEQRAAFQRAVDTWADVISSPVPIRVRVVLREQADPDVLGSAGPSQIGVPEGVPGTVPSTFYPIALANALAGEDLDPDDADIDAEFNSDPAVFSFSEGPPAAGAYDFETVALHEIGHGLGFIGNVEAYTRNGFVVGGWDRGGEPSRLPFVFDRKAIRTNPAPAATLLGLGQDSRALGVALTAGGSAFSGPQLTDLRPCAPIKPPLYTPNQFVPGTSYSHLDEDSYPPGTANSLMTPFINEREVVRTPGAITLAILREIGWQAARLPVSSSLQSCGPAAADAYTQASVQGTAPAGGTVRLWVRQRGQLQPSLKRVVTASATGRFTTTYGVVDDYAWFVTVNDAIQSPVALTRLRPSIAGPTTRSFRKGTAVRVTGRALAGSVVTLRFRPAGTTRPGYPLVRQVRASSTGSWSYGMRVGTTVRFLATGSNGISSATTYLYKAV